MTSAKGQNKFTKTVFMCLVIALGLSTLISELYFEFHYSAVMPHSPQPEIGRIYPQWFKSGGTVYLNRQERDRINFVEYRLMPAFGLTMLLGFGIGVRQRWWDITPKGPFSKF